LFREGPAQQSGGVGPPSHLPQQLVPLLAGNATLLQVRAGELPPVVEEADVVVLRLEGLDLPLDEFVDAPQELADVVRHRKIHQCSISWSLWMDRRVSGVTRKARRRWNPRAGFRGGATPRAASLAGETPQGSVKWCTN